MKLRLFFTAFLLATTFFASAGAEAPSERVALDTVPLASKTESLMGAGKSSTHPPAISPSQQLGAELSKMFQEGAAKLDPPRPKVAPKAAEPANVVPTGGRSLTVQAYAYCLNGRTASGRYTAPGIVAVDPRVIPMGSKLYIPGYGWGVAADTGGAIAGNKIDVWFPTLGQCYQWGVRPVTIQVFPKS